MMMHHLDFDTMIFCYRDFQTDTLISTFQFFSDIGIKNFIFAYELDCDRTSISITKARIKEMTRTLQACKPRNCRPYLVGCPILYEGVAHQSYLSSNKFAHTEYVFTSLPLFTGDAWIPADLNHLLYQQKLKPVFTRFERNLQANSSELMHSISHIPSAIYTFDALYMASPDGFSVVESWIRNELSVIPCVSDRVSDYAGLLKAYERLRDQIPSGHYYALCRAINYTKSLLLHPNRKLHS